MKSVLLTIEQTPDTPAPTPTPVPVSVLMSTPTPAPVSVQKSPPIVVDRITESDKLIKKIIAAIVVSGQVKNLMPYLKLALTSSFTNYTIIIDCIKLYRFGSIKPAKCDMKAMFDSGFSSMAISRCGVYDLHKSILSCKNAAVNIKNISDIIYNWYIYEETVIADLKIVCTNCLDQYYDEICDKETQIEFLDKRIHYYCEYINTIQKRLETIL